MAAALATLNKLEKMKVPQKLNKLGKKLKKSSNKIINDLDLLKFYEFSGNDWWPRLNIKNTNQTLLLHLARQEFVKNGIFMGSSFNLCLAHNNDIIFKKTIKSLEKAFINLKNILEKKNPSRFLKGSKLKNIFAVRR